MAHIMYNKLVRDRIPEIIQSTGKSCTTEVLSSDDYLHMLDAKLDEELAEYHKDQNIEELADLYSGMVVHLSLRILLSAESAFQSRRVWRLFLHAPAPSPLWYSREQ